MGNMMIPFIMLLIVTIALVLERQHHENKISDIYQKKYAQSKDNENEKKPVKSCKELVGLLFLEDEKLNIEVLNPKIIDRLEQKKYNIKA